MHGLAKLEAERDLIIIRVVWLDNIWYAWERYICRKSMHLYITTFLRKGISVPIIDQTDMRGSKTQK